MRAGALALLLWAGCCGVAPHANGAPSADYAPVTAGRAMEFPRDFGSHPQFRTEWWYVTGWVTTTRGESLGFQITFFRTRPEVDPSNPSAFAAHQLLIAHVALSDARRGRLLQDQRVRRAGFGLAEAADSDTHVWIDDWTLERAAGTYRARIAADGFALSLDLADTQPPLLNGAGGVSRKGPAERSASYYYSLPHLRVSGTIARAGARETVTGEAWFDHEWSSEYLDPQARGWDWIGLNLADGAALMAFRIRGADGEAHWAGGTLRTREGVTHFGADAVRFESLRRWTSPRTGISYPVEWRVHVGDRDYRLRPLMDDQENDTRLSTGAIYWEGAVKAFLDDSAPAGQGYLELTGYGDPLKLR